jgi:hypothetical protein
LAHIKTVTFGERHIQNNEVVARLLGLIKGHFPIHHVINVMIFFLEIVNQAIGN